MSADRTSVWILGDQLLLDHPALSAEEYTERGQICVVLIESTARLTQLPYQRKKLVLLLSANATTPKRCASRAMWSTTFKRRQRGGPTAAF